MKFLLFLSGILLFVYAPLGIQIELPQQQSTLSPTQTVVAPTTTPSPTQTPHANPTTSVDSITYISEKAIEASNRSLQFMQWALGIFITVLIGVAGGITAYVTKTLNNATTKLSETKRMYDLVVDEVSKTKEQLDKITNSYLNLQLNYFELQRQTLPYDIAVAAYEDGRITREVFIESQAWHSWQKWAFADDPTGYEELVVFKESPEGLPMSVVHSAITIFVELERNLKIPGRAKAKDKDRSLKLRLLLNLRDQ